MFVVTASKMVGDARHVFRRVAPTTFLSFFLFLEARGITNGFLIQAELVSSSHFRVAASRSGKSEFGQEIEIVSSFLLGWRSVAGSGLRK